MQNGKNFICGILLIISVALLLSSSPVQAMVYDSFKSPDIDTSKWYDSSPSTGLFLQPGNGYLHFNDPTGGQIDDLRSTFGWDTPFFVTLQYSNFKADNNQTGDFKASLVQLKVGDLFENGSVFAYKKSLYEGFQANYHLNGETFHISPPYPSKAERSWLGIGYNGILGAGGEVSLWVDPGKGWKKLATHASNFSDAPYFWIRGVNDDGKSLSFKIAQVDLFPGSLAPYKCNNTDVMIDSLASKIDNTGVQTAPSVQELLVLIDENFDPTPKVLALTKLIVKARDQIDNGNLKAAIGQLKNADKKTDGGSNDLVQGQKVAELNLKIKALKTSLEQEVSFASLSAMIEAAKDQADIGNLKKASSQIGKAYKQTYLNSYGFVGDEAAAELAQMIQNLENFPWDQTNSLALSTSNMSQNPVPPTLLLFGSGLLGIAGLAGWRRFRKG